MRWRRKGFITKVDHLVEFNLCEMILQ
jgi:hypothetical protein